MKKILSLLLAVTMVLGLCACSSSGNSTSTEETGTTGGTEATEAGYRGLQIGYHKISITPTQLGVQIAGGDASARLSQGFLDEVSTTCIAISLDEQLFLVYTMDFMVLNAGSVNAIKPYIMGATGVPYENILLNCTHTHSGVNILSTSWDGAEDYRKMVGTKAAKAAEKAIADLSPAEIEIASTNTEGLAFVRHYLMNDGTTYGNGHGSTASGYKEHLYEAANELQAIRFVRAEEKKKDVLMLSFPAHATTVNGTNSTMLSACWPGAARTYIEENDPDVLVAVFQGASGDQVPDSKIDGLSAAKKDHKKYGQILGDYALGLTYNKVGNDQVVLKSWEYTGPSMKEGIDDPVRMAQASEIKSAASRYGSSHAEVSALVSKYGFPSVYEATGLIDRSNAPDTRTVAMNVLQLGPDCAMVFAAYEMFGDHGEGIKAGSPFEMTFIVTCSEVYMGYLPNLIGCEESFYEYDVTKFERGTGEKLVDEYVNALTELKNAG